ncbi:MAG: S8 family serine peptidase [Cyclobacteriaceae bacterium]
MKIKYTITIILGLTICAAFGQKGSSDFSMTMPGKFVVKFKTVKSSPNSVSAMQDISSNRTFEVKSHEPVFKNINTRKKSKSGIDFSTYHYMYTDKSVDQAKVLEEIGSLDNVEFIEPVYIRRSHYEPNDANLVQQTYLPVIAAFDAWDITTGSGDIIVAIVDSGVDYEHPDLAANHYINEDEIPDNGIDDDNDGYIDNYLGWDVAGADFENIVPDNDPIAKTSNIFHGTSVAGCAAAATDNSIGVAGTGFNAKFMAIKASADNDTRAPGGLGYVLNSNDGVLYAADNGAHVINMSYGGTSFSQFEQDLFTYAAVEKDVVLISSAGNGGTDTPQYPGNYEHVIAVAATDDSDVKASFSEHGDWIDIAAPGVGTRTTTVFDTYSSPNGTSFSSPIVAGAAALLRAYYPDYNQFQIGQLLIRTADDISATEPNFEIAGRLNMHRMLTESTPAVRLAEATIDDGSGELPVPSGSGFVNLKFINELAETSETTTLSINQISSLDITFTSEKTMTIGALLTDQEVDASFGFDLGAEIPFSSKLEFEIIINDTGTGFNESYSLVTVINPLDASVLNQSGIPYTLAAGGDFEIDDGDFLPENISGTGFERGISSITGKDGTASGDNAWVTGLNVAAYLDDSEARLYTPLFDFSTAVGIGYQLEFKANFDFEVEWDGFIVEYSIDQGTNWVKLNDIEEDGWYQTISHPDAVFGAEVPIFSGSTNGQFDTFYTDISFLAGNSQVGFRFLFLSDAAEVRPGLAIDDFKIIAPINGPAVPEFSASVDVTCIDSPVIYTNESTGNFSAIEWDFGANATPATADGIGPHEVSYSAAGDYTVKLTLEGIGDGTHVEEKVDFITVNSPETPIISSSEVSTTAYELSSSAGESYQWYLNGFPIAGATAQAYEATVNGVYAVEVLNNACVGVSENFVLDLILSVEDLLDAGIKIYPNPVKNGKLTINFQTSLIEEIEISIYDLSGAKVKTGPSTRLDKNITFDVSKIESGVYILHLKSEEREYHHRIIIE